MQKLLVKQAKRNKVCQNISKIRQNSLSNMQNISNKWIKYAKKFSLNIPKTIN